MVPSTTSSWVRVALCAAPRGVCSQDHPRVAGRGSRAPLATHGPLPLQGTLHALNPAPSSCPVIFCSNTHRVFVTVLRSPFFLGAFSPQSEVSASGEEGRGSVCRKLIYLRQVSVCLAPLCELTLVCRWRLLVLRDMETPKIRK